MKAKYDKETDTLTITLRDARVKESDEIRPRRYCRFWVRWRQAERELRLPCRQQSKSNHCSGKERHHDGNQNHKSAISPDFAALDIAIYHVISPGGEH